MSEYIHNALLPVLDAPRNDAPKQESPREWPEWLTAREAVQFAGMSLSGIKYYAHTGRLRVRKIKYNLALYHRDGLVGMRKAFGGVR
jgi:hypothetical protein